MVICEAESIKQMDQLLASTAAFVTHPVVPRQPGRDPPEMAMGNERCTLPPWGAGEGVREVLSPQGLSKIEQYLSWVELEIFSEH